MSSEDNRPSLLSLIVEAKEELERREIPYALAGGLAADFYRGEPRATADVDLLVAITADQVEIAKEVLHALGYQGSVATKEMLEGNLRFARRARRGTAQIVVGRSETKPFGIDLLLLSLPWGKLALERSRHNLIDIPLFGKLPCLTVEDMLISKLFALKNSSERRYKKSDIPDIALMLENNTDLNLNYLSDQMIALELPFPKIVDPLTPVILNRISRKLRRRSRLLHY